jgi:3'-5' exoribonuclease
MYTRKYLINNLKENERIEDIFVVKIKKGISPYVNGYFFHLLLSDHTGKTIDYKYWGDSDEEKIKEIYDSIKPDSVVLVQGKVQLHGGKLQISTNPPDTIRVLKEGEYNPEEFIMPPRRDIEEMVKELHAYIESIENPEVKRVLTHIFIEDKEFLEKFKVHPGAIEIHHNWRGGLLQHTLEVARLCDITKKMFDDLNRDLLIAGALLHDIGKLEEITTTTRIKGTISGQLKGHIALGFNKLSNITEKLAISEDIRDRLLHIILSHHGWQSFGSPKEPMFPEALVVYYADEMSSKIAEMIEFKKTSAESTEDDFMYNKRHRRNIYLR